MRRKTVGTGLLLVAVLILGVLIGRRQRTHAPSPENQLPGSAAALDVDSLKVEEAEAPRIIEACGTLKASLTADVAPKIMSKVAAVLVQEGDRVRSGQTLVRLEAADLMAQVRQAEAAVNSARAALSQSRIGTVIQRTQSSTRVEQAKAAMWQVESQLSLIKEGARKQEKQQADESLRQAETGKAQTEEAIKQARAALAAAQAQLGLVQEGTRLQIKRQADAELQQAQANLKTAQATYDRFRSLADDGAISKQRLDEIALQLEIAKGQHETARQQTSLAYEGARTQEVQQAEEAVRQAEAGVRMAEQKSSEAEAAVNGVKAARDMTYEGPRSQVIRQTEEQLRQAKETLRMARAATDENKIKGENVKMLRAQVEQAEASLALARVQLTYATIVAPFSGVVTKRHVDPGAMASPGIPVITIVDSSGFRLEAMVPESKIESVRLGSEAEVRIDALGTTLAGHVAQIVPSADPSTRTSIVKVGLPKVEGLSPGLFGRVRLAVGKTRSMVVPQTALWRKESLTGVFVVESGVARKRLVTLGKVQGDSVEILSGMKEGDTIVANGVERLEEGARVSAASKPSSDR